MDHHIPPLDPLQRKWNPYQMCQPPNFITPCPTQPSLHTHTCSKLLPQSKSTDLNNSSLHIRTDCLSNPFVVVSAKASNHSLSLPTMHLILGTIWHAPLRVPTLTFHSVNVMKKLLLSASHLLLELNCYQACTEFQSVLYLNHTWPASAWWPIIALAITCSTASLHVLTPQSNWTVFKTLAQLCTWSSPCMAVPQPGILNLMCLLPIYAYPCTHFGRLSKLTCLKGCVMLIATWLLECALHPESGALFSGW